MQRMKGQANSQANNGPKEHQQQHQQQPQQQQQQADHIGAGEDSGYESWRGGNNAQHHSSYPMGTGDPYSPYYAGTSFPYQTFGAGDGTWSNGTDPVAFLSGYGGQMGHDAYSMDGMFSASTSGGFGTAFGQPTFNYFPGNGDFSAWSTPRKPRYEDYYPQPRGNESYPASGDIKGIEQNVQGLTLGGGGAGGGAINAGGNGNIDDGDVSRHDPSRMSSVQTLKSEPKEPRKITWASVASQPAKPTPPVSTTLVMKKKAGMPPPPIVPGKHNMDIGTWGDGKTSVPPPKAPPPPEIQSPGPPLPVVQRQRPPPTSWTGHPPTSSQRPSQPQSQSHPHSHQHSQQQQQKQQQQTQSQQQQPQSQQQHQQSQQQQIHQSQMQQAPPAPIQLAHHPNHPASQQTQQHHHQHPPPPPLPPPHHHHHQHHQQQHHHHQQQEQQQHQQRQQQHHHSQQQQSHSQQSHHQAQAQQQPQSSSSKMSHHSQQQHHQQQQQQQQQQQASSQQLAPLQAISHPILDDLKVKNDYNPVDFDQTAPGARFFVIKSYSEDDIHRSIKYEIWCSTEHGNKRLDQAYRDANRDGSPLYLFFSVNGSGHFCGMAQMVSSVDYHSNSSVWSQDKWKGQFRVRWIYVKDVPNVQLRHIKLENNENKPVTNSRDAQEVPHAKGIHVLRILHTYRHSTSIFDDFGHYERRQAEEDQRKTSSNHMLQQQPHHHHQPQQQQHSPPQHHHQQQQQHQPQTGRRNRGRVSGVDTRDNHHPHQQHPHPQQDHHQQQQQQQQQQHQHRERDGRGKGRPAPRQ